MPIRSGFPSQMPDEDLEHLRKGTREQFESPWTNVIADDSFEFTHLLGEIPWLIDVIKSTDVSGLNPLVADQSSDVTIVKTGTTITLTNEQASTVPYTYFRVRAM